MLSQSTTSQLCLYLKLFEFYVTDVESIRVFDCKKLRYVWDHEKLMFIKLCGLDNNITTSTLHQQVGLTLAQQYLR